MARQNYIQVGENEYLNLEDPKEKFCAITWVFNNGRMAFIEGVILNPFGEFSLMEYIDSDNYSRGIVHSKVISFFRMFFKSQIDNFLSDYLLNYAGETDKVKESRLDQLLIGLISFADYCWDAGAHVIDYEIKNKEMVFTKEKDQLKEYHFYHYMVLKELKGLYDLIWDYYSVFINKDRHIFTYVYSNKESPQIENSKSLRNKDKSLTRDTIFNYLFNSLKSQEIFQKYEDKLVEKQFLNDEKNKWLKDASSLIRFYNYCEEKKLFTEEYETSSIGVKYLRDLFTFHEGTDIDKPSKRKMQNNRKHENQFFFLNGVTGFKFQRDF